MFDLHLVKNLCTNIILDELVINLSILYSSVSQLEVMSSSTSGDSKYGWLQQWRRHNDILFIAVVFKDDIS